MSADEENLGEFSLRAVVLGSLFGILFGAVSVYVGLARRAHGFRLHSYRGAFDQHTARLWALHDSRK